jgi:predicted nuclease with TOPRIM domain
MRACLILSRLVVMRRGRALFDQRFHTGVNIIHGDNGSGKTTIADFIFFVLGGDLKKWKPHAELAEFVLAEIVTEEATLVLRRDVSKEIGRGMQVFFGGFDEALNAGPAAWQVLPYKRSDQTFSFSQVLFRAIGIPESVSEGSSNITMHQLLRVLYGDQLTPIQRIFRDEDFDTWQIRQAVGELLCGIGGYELYEKQIAAREMVKRYDEIAAQYRSLTAVASSYGDKILTEHVEAAIQKTSNERDELVRRLGELSEPQEILEKELQEIEVAQKAASRELTNAKRSVADLEDKIETLNYEVADAERFISHVQQSLVEFEDAASTFFALGQVKFEFCPSCFSPIKDSNPSHHCHLCGSETLTEEADSKALAVRLDLQMQLRESRVLQEERETALRRLKADLRIEKHRLTRAANSDAITRRGTLSGREEIVAQLSRRLGFLDSELGALQGRLELSRELARVSELKEKLNSALSALKDEIEAITTGQAKRKQVAYTRVSSIAKAILDSDLKEHSDFGKVDYVSFNFAGDWIAVNDDKNRSRSASGMVVLKNSFLVSLLFASIEDQQFNLPRFMLLDNIEDKGMVQERSWNFQHIMVEASTKAKGPHQLIFTTSKISPQLADSPHIVGRKYTKLHPTLEFATGDGRLDSSLV